MIEKEKTTPTPKDKWGKAGHDAEKQMAHYLRRTFADSSDVFVFNDLRIERKGEFAQLDHLVLHRYGFVVVESKSVVGQLTVNAKGEFVRVYGRQRRGIASPIQQGRRQAHLLRALLNDHKEDLRRKVMFGTSQGSFVEERFRVLVAISDQGIINRDNCDPPELWKADTVPLEIRGMISEHDRAGGVGGFYRLMTSRGEEAEKIVKAHFVPFTDEELLDIRTFIRDRHVPLQRTPVAPASPPKPPSAPPKALPRPVQVESYPAPPPKVGSSANCKSCAGSNLEIRYGKYGYYYKCRDCGKNTRIDLTCVQCGERARVRKSGNNFSRVCEHCGTEKQFHQNPAS